MIYDDTDIPKMLSTQQVMEFLQISRQTLYRYVKSRKLKAYRIGKQLKFKEEDVKTFIESREVNELD